MLTKNYFVYIATNKLHTVFYTGVTNNLKRRMYEHVNKMVNSFTSRYNIAELVYYEITNNIETAIMREKQIKDYRREKKLQLIKKFNPKFNNLSNEI